MMGRQPGSRNSGGNKAGLDLCSRACASERTWLGISCCNREPIGSGAIEPKNSSWDLQKETKRTKGEELPVHTSALAGSPGW